MNFSDLLARKCMLINLHLRQWSGRVQDKEITEEIIQSKAAEFETGRFWKYLVSDKLAPVTKYANKLRNWIYSWSYSWQDLSGDSGDHWRLVTVDVYEQQKQELKERIRNLKDLWSEFIANYPSYVEEDMRRMGGMAKRSDYPSPEIIATKFDVVFNIRQIPVSGDFRIELADQEFAEMQRKAVEKDRQIVDGMISTAWQKIREPLEHFVERLQDPENVFKQATIRNLQSTITLMRGFNVTQDPNIEKILTEIESKLSQYSWQDIKENQDLRKKLATEAQSIVTNFQSYF